jgi:dihydrodipicolinate synthase/N-acetylneuraminate lyase
MVSSDVLPAAVGQALRRGVVLPAMPLALTAERRFDERRQRALCRYYFAAGTGGLAVGVHTTQFAIRDPHHGLHRPVLQLVAEEFHRHATATGRPLIRVAGVCGSTAQAVAEAALARELGYHAGLLNLAALKDADDDSLVAHCAAVAEVLPVFGFYLQPGPIGGRVLSYRFWRRFAEIERVVAIKVAPFNRYQTFDVVRAVAEAGRDDIALYTGNDDQIVLDLLTPFRIQVAGRRIERRIVGGLLGQWAVGTHRAVELLNRCHALAPADAIPTEMLRLAWEVTDFNAAVFDAANDYAGCIPGVHEVLRRHGLLEGTWCLDPTQTLGPGQAEELDRVYRAYPHLMDDDFVARHRDEWLRA